MVNLRDAHEEKKRRSNEVLTELMTKKEKIPNQIQQLELSRDRLNQKISNILSLVNAESPLTVLQEQESERRDFCDVQVDSERRIRELQEEYRR